MPFTDRAHAGRRLAGCLQRFRDEDVVVLGLPRGGVPVAYQVARGWVRRSTSSWSASSACPSSPSWPWVPSARAGCGSSTRTSCAARGSPTRSWRRSRPASGPSWSGGPQRFRGAAARDRAGGTHGRSWSTTASPPGRRPARHARWPARTAPPGSCSRCRWRRRDSIAELRARRRRARLPGDAEPVRRDRPVLRRLLPDHRRRGRRPARTGRRAVAAAPVARPVRAAGRSARRDEDVAVDGRTGRSSAGSPFPTAPPASWCSPTAAAAAATARATATSPRCSTQAGLGTLLFDLLTPAEEARPGQRVRHRPARPPAGRRHRLAARAARDRRACRIGYFGASTGAAAALWAAAEPGADVAAVVSRGGRPDLAGAAPRWRDRADAADRRRRTTRSCSTSTGKPRRSCAARAGSRSCRAPPTCSRSRARWPRWPTWRASGSSATSLPAATRCLDDERPRSASELTLSRSQRLAWPALSGSRSLQDVRPWPGRRCCPTITSWRQGAHRAPPPPRLDRQGRTPRHQPPAVAGGELVAPTKAMRLLGALERRPRRSCTG